MVEANCYAILFADKVIREDNGKIGVIGMFEHFFSQVVPFQPMPWGIFIGIDNLPPGKYVLTANLVHEETQAVVLPIQVTVEQKMAGAVQLPIPVSVLFQSFGQYSFTVNLNGSQIGSRVLDVKKLEMGAGGNAGLQ